MLRNAMRFQGFKVEATDGRIGSVRDLYFDDADWGIRYVVVDTGHWLAGRPVLLTPSSLQQPLCDKRVFPVCLTRKQVQESPGVDADKPVSLQRLSNLVHQYYLSCYWGPPCPGPTWIPVAAGQVGEPEGDTISRSGDPHLRSMGEVCSYHVQASDGEIGHVEDFVVDERDWVIRYVVIDTRNWLPGRKVLVPPLWLDRISWDEKMAHVDLERDVIRNAPPYDPSQPIRRSYEVNLYGYYGKPGYWVCETFLGV